MSWYSEKIGPISCENINYLVAKSDQTVARLNQTVAKREQTVERLNQSDRKRYRLVGENGIVFIRFAPFSPRFAPFSPQFAPLF